MADEVRVRFAPSPTGHLHIGGLRTALFNWLFARHCGGKFILRVEDTDVARSTRQSIEAILEAMRWVGLDWDEGPYFQSDRLHLYRAEAKRLLEEGKAYLCYCSREELEARRKDALARGEKPKYDGKCRNLKDAPAGIKPAMRFRSDDAGTTVVEDLIHGPVTFDNSELDDLVILRSDNIPTYNFAVVVDDASMGITHIIRGDDHLANTPRQIQLYLGLDYQPPKFAHLPMILGPDKARLSKRHGATSVIAYREVGYLPEALLNYLARLGWSYGDQEIFSSDELIKYFSLDGIGKSAAVFNPEKLLWLNAHYMRSSSPERLARLALPFLKNEAIDLKDDDQAMEKLTRATGELQARSKTLIELARSARCFFAEEIIYDERAAAKFLSLEVLPPLEELLSAIEQMDEINSGQVEAAFKRIIDARRLKLIELAQPVRVALTGSAVSPGIYEVIAIMGKELVRSRLKRAISYIKQKWV